ncbi:hypothetical protein SO802_029963 [Lithocarpus litseifolius]|uniref:Uncharacterized protein n=1 Tax=Lithocarpus litseifolius TaxID=425828 RepID=A0AAW2BUT9_9ROSI
MMTKTSIGINSLTVSSIHDENALTCSLSHSRSRFSSCSHCTSRQKLNWLGGRIFSQTTSKRLSERKVAKFQKNITKRGLVPETTSKKGYDYPVEPITLDFLR